MGRVPEYILFQRRNMDGQQAHEKMFNIINHQGNSNQKPSWDITSHLSEWPLSKRTTIKCWQGCGEMEPYYTGGSINWCSHYGKQYGVSSKNLK